MKLVTASLFIFLISQTAFTQDSVSIKQLQLDTKMPVKIEIPITGNIETALLNDSLARADIKSANWDSSKFNPYKNERIKYPIQLTFEDKNYSSPMKRAKVVTSRFGWRWGRAHQGIDIDLVTGDDVFTVLGGIVRYVNYHSGHGKTVIVRHFNGLETTYAHLSRYKVKVNDTVSRGQLLGKGGATGNARGSHLHFIASYKGVAINPEYLFDFSESNALRSTELWVTRTWTNPYFHTSRRQSKLVLLRSEEEAIASLIKEKKVYVVKRGDTLSRIARRNNISIRTICVTNKIRKTSLLKIGQKLILEL